MNECRHRWNRYWTFGSLAVIFASAAAAMAMGRFTISPRELAAVLVPGAFPGEEVPGQVRTVISNIRLPRVLLALLSGAGLAAAGAAFQGLFANPLATPDTLGAANGASFGAVLGILLGLPAFGIHVVVKWWSRIFHTQHAAFRKYLGKIGRFARKRLTRLRSVVYHTYIDPCAEGGTHGDPNRHCGR